MSLARRLLPAGIAVLFMLFMNSTLALAPEEAGGLLRKADKVKTSDYSEFTSIMKLLGDEANELSPSQRQHLQYLRGWQIAYEGDYENAVAIFKTIVADSTDTTLQVRAHATMVNVLVIAKRYEEAFAQLSRLLELLPKVSDRDARDQGLGVASLLYNRVGQYDLSVSYAEKLTQEGANGRGACTGRELKLDALYRSTKLQTVGSEFQAGIDACVKAGEVVFANLIRTYMAKLHIDRGRYGDAIALLQAHREEARRTRYPPLIAELDALLAQAYRQTGDPVRVQQFALSAIEGGVKNEYTEAMVTAYRLLYLVAREQGDYRAALEYHEKYAAADKGYLDDVSARHLAYERVNQAAIASELKITSLNQQNEVLQLQQALDKKAVETGRLYIALLIICLGFIVFWAYKTKRSQLHFRKLSQQDGLTGIANRPHFIEQAESALANARKMQQEVCVVLCDLDHFKAINDRYGHAAGDFVLRQTVAACRTHLGPADIFGRFGGEEFGIVLPGCSLEAARVRCEQLRAAIVDVASAQQGMEAKVSASFGIATTGLFDYELRQLLAHADAALYQAKRAGRNRVVAYDVSDAIDELASIAADEG